ncbi:MAG TPA: hypothetical protein VMQ83_11420 [Gammaproteobacteria bacterium]|nr:hypothetical protein [Gammaproteobacteria bacterium]
MRHGEKLAIVALVLLMGGCGSGGGSGGSTPPPPPPPPPDELVGGIWAGEMVATGGGTIEIRGLITESGEFRWLDDTQGQQIFGTIDVDGTAISSTDAISALPWGSFTPAGSRHGSTELTGTIDERVSMEGDFTTDGEVEGDQFTGTFSLTYDDVYERPSSLATLAGTYTTTDDSLAIDAAGIMFYQSAANNCVANGTAELIDAAFNMYRVTLLAESCTGNDSVRNGLTFTGLAHLKDSTDAMNDTIVFAVSAQSGDGYVIWSHEAQK